MIMSGTMGVLDGCVSFSFANSLSSNQVVSGVPTVPMKLELKEN